AWAAGREARGRADELREAVARSTAESEELTLRLAELARLDPREGEEPVLAGERAVLGAAEKALADISEARQALDGLTGRLAQAVRAIEHARTRAIAAGAGEDAPAVARLAAAGAAIDRVFSEAQEAEAAVDAA